MTSDDAWLGLTDPDSLALERAATSTNWARQPYVALEDHDLAFWWARVTQAADGYRATLSSEETEARRGLLEDFVRLAVASDEVVLAYAQRWGALGICAHNLPRGHPPTRSHPRATYLCEDWRRPAGGDPIAHLESLAVWRYVAGRAAIVLDLATGLWVEPPDLGTEVQWDRIGKKRPTDSVPARATLASEVNLWVQLGQVRAWAAPDPPLVRIGGHDLMGALAVELLLATSRSSGWAVCSHCAHPYAPKRRPQRGRFNYCPTCRVAGMASRAASQNYRRKRASLSRSP